MKVYLKAKNLNDMELDYSPEIARSIKWDIYDALLFNENPLPSEEFDEYWKKQVMEIRIVMEDE